MKGGLLLAALISLRLPRATLAGRSRLC
eukprot:SAG31_NODE_46644_length_253_cov_1.012987_1_plen_27_part_01